MPFIEACALYHNVATSFGFSSQYGKTNKASTKAATTLVQRKWKGHYGFLVDSQREDNGGCSSIIEQDAKNVSKTQ